VVLSLQHGYHWSVSIACFFVQLTASKLIAIYRGDGHVCSRTGVQGVWLLVRAQQRP
jgi:hypothetical protein